MAKKVEIDFKKLLVAAIAFVIIAAVGSAFATYLMFRGDKDPYLDTNVKESKLQELGPVFPVGEFILNLNSSNNLARFIRTEIALEADNKKVIDELEKRKPQIRDAFITLIRSRSVEQLNSEAGMELLRFEMMKQVNGLVSKGQINNVFFIDLIIQ